MEMTDSVERINLSAQQLYRLHDFVDELKISNQVIRQDGVFLGIVDTSAGETTPFHHFMDKLKDQNSPHADEHHQPPTKQVPISFPHCPELFGYRSYSCGEDVQGDIQICSPADIQKFFNTNLEASSYSNPTCCTKILDSHGVNGLLDHLWTETKRVSVSIKNLNHKKFSKSCLLKKGKKDFLNYRKFTTKLLTLSNEQKMEVVNKAMLNDKRKGNEGCCHASCIVDDITKIGVEGVMYGSGVPVKDSDNFLMTESFKMSALSVITPLRLLKHHYFGLTRPMLYYGTSHSFFPAHYEDMSLFSVNFIHCGHPKLWIVVPPTSVTKLRDALMDSGSNLMHTSCPNVLGHKYFLPTTSWLQNKSIPFKVIVQRVREAVVLYPNAVHFGFNLGPNVAEAANFPSMAWVPYGMAAPKCHCIPHQIHLNLEPIVSACHPQWLDILLAGEIPTDVSEADNPDFYRTILPRDNRDTVTAITTEDVSNSGDGDGGGSAEDDKSDDDKFPSTNKRRGRKVACCPKPSCSKTYSGGKVSRLLQHVKKIHSSDPLFNQFLEQVTSMCPPRDKVPKQECTRCGKLVAGRASQMQAHMSSSGCGG